MHLYFDIETVANDNAHNYFANKVYEPNPKLLSTEPPKSITSIKTDELRKQRIAEWQNERVLKLENSVINARQKDQDKAGLKWWTGKIVCISTYTSNDDQPVTFFGSCEKQILCDFFDYLLILSGANSSLTLMGMRNLDFDEGFIIGRAIANDIGLPRYFQRDDIRDIDKIFGFKSGQTGKLDDYAFGSNIPTKTSHGSEVQGMYDLAILGDKSKWNDLINYCNNDALIVKTIHQRYMKPYISRVFKTETADVVNDVPF